MTATLLIVDDEKHTREGLEMALEDDYDVFLASSADEAFNLMEVEQFDIVLTDLRMAGKSGLKVIDHALRLSPQPVCIMMTAYGSVETAVEAMKRGAFDFLTKPVNLEKLEILLKRALQSRDLEKENKVLHQRLDQKYQFDGMIGHSETFEAVLEKVRIVAPSKATILLFGETGTGKELVAQAIHQNSPRSRQPFIAVNCAALAPNLLESELFGHEKGAFTGAIEKRVGRFEAANGGTLFLDEIGEIDPSTQVKLLRFLETRTLERLGSLKPIPVDVRLVGATNKNLEKLVQDGTFREDLFYRLKVVQIDLPSLRERRDDIPLLLDHYFKIFASENDIAPVILSPETVQLLIEYRWPGNIRELRNLCENLAILHAGQTLSPYDLEERFHSNTGPGSRGGKTLESALSVEDNEKRLLRQALQKSGGNRTEAARLMGISRRTLHRKLLQWPELDVNRK